MELFPGLSLARDGPESLTSQETSVKDRVWRSSHSHLGLAACAVVLGLARLLVVLRGNIVELLHSVSSSGGEGLPLGGCLVHG